MNRQRLLERFLRYVQVDTTANDSSGRYPSSEGQLVLGRMLVEELQEIGVSDAHQDGYGLVYATIPPAEDAVHAPAVALNAHLDTSPEAPGKNVRPQVVSNYDGQDLRLPGRGEAVIRVAENPELRELTGKTLITTDGTTLLGADDKAGVAIIMEVVECLLESNTKRPTVRVLFTCDEEIGLGVQHVDLDKLDAQVCYTIDGPGAGHIDVETFSADLATVTLNGVNIHPAIAKDRMTNAVKMTSALLEAISDEPSPEVTHGRQGFLHPYMVSGGVASAELKILIRDFDTVALTGYAEQLRKAIAKVEDAFPNGQLRLEIQPQYRNLADGLAAEPRAVALAELAHHRLSVPCIRSIIRGGTDGSQLTERGLPTPNLSSGQHNPHSLLEWACLDEMAQSVDVTLQVLKLWAEQS